MELLTQTERSTTVMAIRDSELAKMPEGLFNNIKLKHSVVMTRLIKLLGERLLGESPDGITLSLGCVADISWFREVGVLALHSRVKEILSQSHGGLMES